MSWHSSSKTPHISFLSYCIAEQIRALILITLQIRTCCGSAWNGNQVPTCSSSHGILGKGWPPKFLEESQVYNIMQPIDALLSQARKCAKLGDSLWRQDGPHGSGYCRGNGIPGEEPNCPQVWEHFATSFYGLGTRPKNRKFPAPERASPPFGQFPKVYIFLFGTCPVY